MSINVTSQPGNNGIKPEAPTGQSAVAVAGTASNSAGGATVSFTTSTNPGKGTANYIATSNPGGFTASAASSPITYSSGVLSIGSNYTFTIVKQSGSGVDSDASSATNSITAFTIPTAPTISLARQASQTLRISLSAGANANGSAITSYQYRIKTSAGAYGSYITLSGTTGPWDIGSLTNGTTYVVQVRAVNSAGTGDPSNEPSAVPYTTPGTVSPSAARTASQQVTVSWSAPSNGGESIDAYYYRYKVSASADSSYSAWTSTTSLSAVIGSLTNGTQYTFQVYAENAAGAGGTGSATATPYTTPATPTVSVSNMNQSRATLNANVSSNGGSGLTAVTFYYRVGSSGGWTSSASGVDAGSGNYYANITGLSVGTTYNYFFRATNAAGDSDSSVGSFTTWSLKNAYSTSTTGSFNIPTVTPTGGSAVAVSIYNIALVGGGGGAGFGSGGAGGQLKSYSSAAVNAPGNNISWTIGGPGTEVLPGNGRATSGGTTSISGTSSTLSAPGGEGGQADYPAVGTRSLDGGSTADNTTIYLGGSGTYGDGGKSGFVVTAGGGAGAGGHGGDGQPNVKGGLGGAAGSAYGLTSVGGGGDGFSNSGGGSGNTNHSASMRGRGASGGDPNSIIYPYADVYAVGGAISFDYYGP